MRVLNIIPLVIGIFLGFNQSSFAMIGWSCKGEDCQEDRMNLNVKDQKVIEAKIEQPVPSTPRKVRLKKVNQVVHIHNQAVTPAIYESGFSGNLPMPLLARNLDKYQLEGKPTLVASNTSPEKYEGVHIGDIVHALLEQQITASPSVPTPIRVEVLDGSAKGAFLVGEAVLESDLKRVILRFNRLRDSDGGIYQISANGLSPSGEVGLIGEYHAQDGAFFVAELLTAGIAGFADGTINRTQNSIGNYVEEPGLDTAAKKGMVSALGRTSERMADRVKAAPGYTQTRGYQVIPVIVTEEPVRKRG